MSFFLLYFLKHLTAKGKRFWHTLCSLPTLHTLYITTLQHVAHFIEYSNSASASVFYLPADEGYLEFLDDA